MLTNIIKSIIRVSCYLVVFSLQIHCVGAQTPQLVTLFQQQISKTCLKPFTYQKQVVDLTTTIPSTEQKEYNIAAKSEDLLKQELEYATLYNANEPKLKGEYRFSTAKDTILAKAIQTKQDLKFQKWVLSPDKKSLRFLESQIDKSYWLYELSVKIQVFFDENGLYQRHILITFVKIPYIGNYFSSKITGLKK